MKYSKFLWLVRKEMERRIRSFKDTGVVLYFMCNAASYVAVQADTPANYTRLLKEIRELLGGYASFGAWLSAVHVYNSQWQTIQFRRYFLRRLHKAALLEEKQQSLKGKKNG